MKIFFGSHYGSDISELESGYLIWIIEKYEAADWLLINECKKELSERLKLDWKEPEHEVQILRRKLKVAEALIEHLENVIGISTMCGGNLIRVESMMNCPKLVYEFLNINK